MELSIAALIKGTAIAQQLEDAFCSQEIFSGLTGLPATCPDGHFIPAWARCKKLGKVK